MDREALLKLVHFDPGALEKAIKKVQEEAEALERQRSSLLELAGVYQWLLRVHAGGQTKPQHGSHTTDSTLTPNDRRFRGKTHEEAALVLLTENGGRMNGRKILEGMALGGLKVGGKIPMATLAAALRRSSRIEKDPTEQNTWQLKKQGALIELGGKPVSVEH